MLDYDGTLAPFCIDRKTATIDTVIIKPLKNILLNKKIKTAIVTGRSSAEMITLWQLPATMQIWGSHGRERMLENGEHRAELLSDKEVEGFRLLSKALLDIAPENSVEVKPFSVAFHTRGMTQEQSATIKKAQELMAFYADNYAFNLHRFNGGLELKTKGYSKADAAKTMMDEFKNYPVAYFGDDLTDEDAFEVVNGVGLAVLVGEYKKNSKSNFFMSSRQELSEFLHELDKVLQ